MSNLTNTTSHFSITEKVQYALKTALFRTMQTAFGDSGSNEIAAPPRIFPKDIMQTNLVEIGKGDIDEDGYFASVGLGNDYAWNTEQNKANLEAAELIVSKYRIIDPSTNVITSIRVENLAGDYAGKTQAQINALPTSGTTYPLKNWFFRGHYTASLSDSAKFSNANTKYDGLQLAWDKATPNTVATEADIVPHLKYYLQVQTNHTGESEGNSLDNHTYIHYKMKGLVGLESNFTSTIVVNRGEGGNCTSLGTTGKAAGEYWFTQATSGTLAFYGVGTSGQGGSTGNSLVNDSNNLNNLSTTKFPMISYVRYVGETGFGASSGGSGGGGSGSLYDFSSHTFTRCGATGRFGPSLSDCTTEYSSTTWASNTAYFNQTIAGMQDWTVPQTGTYTITAVGAAGGDGGYSTNTAGGSGGPGAKITRDVALTGGEVIRILVGQQGFGDTTYSHCPGGGGGGTFITRAPHNTLESIIIIAGGGGGGGQTYWGQLHNGQNESFQDVGGADNGITSSSNGYSDGAGGKGPSNNTYGGNGGGFWGDGHSSGTGEGTTCGHSYVNSSEPGHGGKGSTHSTKSEGGFGGGGAGNLLQGAGGGFAGGKYEGYWSSSGKAYGGSSYVQGEGPLYKHGNPSIVDDRPHAYRHPYGGPHDTNRHGYVTIVKKLPLGIMNGDTNPAYLLDVEGDVGLGMIVDPRDHFDFGWGYNAGTSTDNGDGTRTMTRGGQDSVYDILNAEPVGGWVDGVRYKITIEAKISSGTGNLEWRSGWTTYWTGGLTDEFQTWVFYRVGNWGPNYFKSYISDVTFKQFKIETRCFNIADGNVGIGTTSPSQKLDIVGDGSSGTGRIRFTDTDGADNARNWFVGPYRSSDACFAITPSASKGGTSPDLTKTLQISYNGNVGIGLTSPGGPLHISANQHNVNAYNGLLRLHQTVDAGSGIWGMINFPDSNTSSTEANGNYYLIGRGHQYSDKCLTLHVPTAGSIDMCSTGAVRMMKIQGNGNVGIGTTGPGAKLEVRHDGGGDRTSWTGDILRIRNYVGTNNDRWFTFGVDGTCGWIQSVYNSTNSAWLSLNPLGGNVGIGTDSPYHTLHIDGGNTGSTAFNDVVLKLSGTSTTNNGSIGMLFNMREGASGAKSAIFSKDYAGTWNRSSLVFCTNNHTNVADATLSDARMVIRETGNVGIGMTNPEHTLQITKGSSTNNITLSDALTSIVATVEPNYGKYGLYFGVHASNGWSWIQTGRSGTSNLSSTGEQFNLILQPIAGYVGIGTDSPSEKLHVEGNIQVKYAGSNQTSNGGWKRAQNPNEVMSGSGTYCKTLMVEFDWGTFTTSDFDNIFGTDSWPTADGSVIWRYDACNLFDIINDHVSNDDGGNMCGFIGDQSSRQIGQYNFKTNAAVDEKWEAFASYNFPMRPNAWNAGNHNRMYRVDFQAKSDCEFYVGFGAYTNYSGSQTQRCACMFVDLASGRYTCTAYPRPAANHAYVYGRSPGFEIRTGYHYRIYFMVYFDVYQYYSGSGYTFAWQTEPAASQTGQGGSNYFSIHSKTIDSVGAWKTSTGANDKVEFLCTQELGTYKIQENLIIQGGAMIADNTHIAGEMKVFGPTRLQGPTWIGSHNSIETAPTTNMHMRVGSFYTCQSSDIDCTGMDSAKYHKIIFPGGPGSVGLGIHVFIGRNIHLNGSWYGGGGLWVSCYPSYYGNTPSSYWYVHHCKNREHTLWGKVYCHGQWSYLGVWLRGGRKYRCITKHCNMWYNGNESISTAETIATGSAGWSDDRIKHNEKPINNALSVINKLEPLKYIKTEDKMYSHNHHFTLDSSGNPYENGKALLPSDWKIESGFVAQSVEKIEDLKYAVQDGNCVDSSGNRVKALEYNDIFVYNVAATQELDKKVSPLILENQQLKEKVAELEDKLNEITAHLGI